MNVPTRPPLVLLAVAFALVAVIGVGLWRWSRFNDLWLVNALPVAVEVSIDGKRSVQLAANTGREKVEGLGVGTHVVVVKHGGRELETTLVFVLGGSHELVYNVGGAAPLAWEKIAYTTRATGQEPQWTLYCGRRFVVLGSIDHVFVEPPRSVSVKGGGTVYRTHLTVYEGGLKTCHSWALDRGTVEMWLDLQRLEAKLDASKVVDVVEELARQGDLREAQLLLEQAMEEKSGFELRRVHEQLLIASDQTEKARELYAREAADEKAADVDLYLSAVLKAPDERIAFLDEALQRFPRSAYLRWLKGQTLDREGQSDKAIAEYELAETAREKDLEWWLFASHARALLHANRKAEAWALAASLYKDSASLDGALAYARVARATGNSEAGWDAKLKPQAQRWGQALLDLPVTPVKTGANEKDWDPASFKKARELIQLTVRQTTVAKKTYVPPLGALALVAKASDSELRLLPDDVVWLLLTEAWRVGDSVAATKLSRQATGATAPRLDDAATFIATGQLSPRLDLASDTVLGVLWLARARRLATLGEDAAPALALARRFDAYGTLVTRALERWDPAKPGAHFAWLPVP